jgi:small subunit ribosomal protein S20
LANIASQIKRNRQNEKRRLRNRGFRGAARSAVRTAMASMTGDQASPAGVTEAIRALDKAARKGSIHHRNAARRKSRIMKRLAAVGLQLPSGAAPAESAPGESAPARGRRSTKVEKGAAPEAEAKDVAAKKAAKKVATKKTAKK